MDLGPGREARLLPGALEGDANALQDDALFPDLVFPNVVGGASDPSDVYKRFERALNAAGMPDARFSRSPARGGHATPPDGRPPEDRQ